MEAPGEGEKVMLFRDGFYKDFIILIVLTIILGAVFPQNCLGARLVFWGQLDDMIGGTVNTILFCILEKNRKMQQCVN